MKLLRYFIFVIFNFAYKDGTRPPNASPYFAALSIVMLYQGFIFLATLSYIDEYLIDGLIAGVSKPLEGIIYGFGMLVYALIYLPNHYYFIKKKKFDAFYQEFRHGPINTKRNQKIAYTYWILLLIVLLILLGVSIMLNTK